MPSALRYGCKDPDVQRLQESLNKLVPPALKLKVDGELGPLTDAAIRWYQATVGIGIDGVVGPITWNALAGKAPVEIAATEAPAKIPDAPWISVAAREIGQSQIKGSHHNPRILEYHACTSLHASNDETAWCSSFVNWCLLQVGIAGTKSAAAISWQHWGSHSSAKQGAITVIYSIHGAGRSASGYHVGFFFDDCGPHFRLLGGNQSHQVKVSRYPRSSWHIVAFRWPNQK
jgi:uncharacterized protein (TIGR02594 family)